MAAGGSGASSMYTVHYRRTDGTEASGQAEPNEFGGFSWLAPEDCAAVTGLTEVGGGGAGRELWTPMPGERAVFAGMRVTVQPGTRPDPRDTVGHQVIRQPDADVAALRRAVRAARRRSRLVTRRRIPLTASRSGR